MNDPLVVGCIQSISNLYADLEQALMVQGPATDHLPQRGPFQILHGDVAAPGRLADVINCADIRMVQRGGGLRLSLKARQACGSVAISSDRNFSATKRCRRLSSA